MSHQGGSQGIRVIGRRRSGRRSGSEERGYVLVVTTILIVALLGVVALALDVAILYARSQSIQRSADAAALAGVAYLPRTDTAILKAEETADRNGFRTGGSVSVVASTDPASPRRLNVTIEDNDVPSFFAGMFTSGFTLSRTATAEYFSRIPLGSAFNSIGTGDLPGAVPTASGSQGFWLAASGFCTAKEDGDAILSRWDGTRGQDADVGKCGPTGSDPVQLHVNKEYSPNGYDYLVSVPCPGTPTGTGVCAGNPGFTVQVYDPVFDPNDESGTDPRIDYRNLNFVGQPGWNDVRVSTMFRSYAPDWTTPYDRSDDVPMVSPPPVYGTCPASPCLETGKWVTLLEILPARWGTWRVNVSTEALEANSFGTNSFALRAVARGTPSPTPHGPAFVCSAIVSTGCPSVSGDSTMGIYANAPATATGGQVEFFLAQLKPARDFRGKRVKVTLWDPGEGAQKIEILPPSAAPSPPPVQFHWRTWYPGLARLDDTAITDEASGWTPAGPTLATELDVSGPAMAPTPDGWDTTTRTGTNRFNDRNVSLELSIPTNYGLDASGNETPLPEDGWWKIRYTTASGTVTDRTTWSLQLIDEPVHLVD